MRYKINEALQLISDTLIRLIPLENKHDSLQQRVTELEKQIQILITKHEQDKRLPPKLY